MDAADLAELNGRIAIEFTKQKAALKRAKVQLPSDQTITDRILEAARSDEIDIRPLLARLGKRRRRKPEVIGFQAEQS